MRSSFRPVLYIYKKMWELHIHLYICTNYIIDAPLPNFLSHTKPISKINVYIVGGSCITFPHNKHSLYKFLIFLQL